MERPLPSPPIAASDPFAQTVLECGIPAPLFTNKPITGRRAMHRDEMIIVISPHLLQSAPFFASKWSAS
jgi:hypothetical protein